MMVDVGYSSIVIIVLVIESHAQGRLAPIWMRGVLHGDMLGIRLPIDFANFYQIAQSTSSTESYSEGFTLIASILHKIVSNTVSERT